ncbi:unnamed protein product, partial [Clonostachys solani]
IHRDTVGEKNELDIIDSSHVEASVKAEDGAYSDPLSDAEKKKIIRRVDMRLLPILGVMYSISLIDRINLGLALVSGMQEGLELAVGSRYTIIVMVFFVAYMYYIRDTKQSYFTEGWARKLVVLLRFLVWKQSDWHGLYPSLGTMALCRAILGMFEAGFLPGCTYLITCWYTRYEVGKRMSGFWILSVIASGFSGILAYVLSLLKGRHGLNGWRCTDIQEPLLLPEGFLGHQLTCLVGIFIVEGAITCGVCLLGRLIIVDFPSRADDFLSPEEKEFAMRRINQDRGDAEEDKVELRTVLHHLKDWKLYGWAFNLMASTLPGYAYAYFLPIILRDGMGFSTTKAQLLTAPPNIFAAVVTYISGWISDKYKVRGPVIAVHQAITAIGMLVTAYGKAPAARYFGTFLGIGFFQYGIPGVLTFQANNITSHSKRAVSAATCMMGGGVGGIIAGVAFMAGESPHYTTGVWTAFALSMGSIAVIIITDLHLWRCNKAVRAGKAVNEGMEGWMYTL